MLCLLSTFLITRGAVAGFIFYGVLHGEELHPPNQVRPFLFPCYMGKRMLKDWTDSESVDKLSLEAEVFFVRLIMKADDFGNYTGNIKLINAALFPLKGYDPYTVNDWLHECVEAGLVSRYEVDKKPLIHIKNFDQKLRRMHAVYPPPSDGHFTDNERTSDGQLTDKRPPELEVEEKKKLKKEVEGVPFDELFLRAFDEITCERYQMTFGKTIPDLGRELELFRTKCDNDPDDYHKRDVAGLRNAFQYQLKQYKNAKPRTTQDKRAELDRLIDAKYGPKGTTK